MVEMKKLNPIPLSLRERKRYIEFELISEKRLEEKDVSFQLWKDFLSLFGEIGTAKQRLWLAYWNEEKNTGILRCSLKELEKVKAGLLFASKIKDVKVITRILKVSGTIKSLKE